MKASGDNETLMEVRLSSEKARSPGVHRSSISGHEIVKMKRTSVLQGRIKEKVNVNMKNRQMRELLDSGRVSDCASDVLGTSQVLDSVSRHIYERCCRYSDSGPHDGLDDRSEVVVHENGVAPPVYAVHILEALGHTLFRAVSKETNY